MNILGAAVLVTLVAIAGPARAQPVVSSTMEAGWTSNAEAAAGGTSDSYLTQTHTITLATDGLRGTIAFEATRFSRLWRENDWTGSIALESKTRLAPQASLRGSLSFAYGEEGRSVETLSGPLGLVIPSLSGTASVRAETALGPVLIGLDLAYAAQRPGTTRFEADLVPANRTQARTDTLTAGIDIIAPVSPSVALAARAQYRKVLVSPDDQASFGRIPVSLVRLGGGVEFGAGMPTGVLLRGGLDTILADSANSAVFAPYAEGQIRLQLSEIIALNANLLAGADAEDPADGLTDWRLEARAGLRLTPATGFAIDAALFTAQTRSPALDLTIETEHGAELIARWAARDSLTLEALARYRQVYGLAPTYDETRLALRISAAI